MQTKVMVALFGLFAEVERDLISERTKEGLVAALLGRRPHARPPERFPRARSKLDGKEGESRMLLEKQVSKASIAKIVGVSSTNLRHFIRTQNSPQKPQKAGTGSAILKGYFYSNRGGTLTLRFMTRVLGLGLKGYLCSNLGGTLTSLTASTRTALATSILPAAITARSSNLQGAAS